MYHCRLRSRRGFVLVSVLILSTVLISSAAALSWFVRLQARTSASQLNALTSRSAALSILNSVMNASVELGQRTDYDSPLQKWYLPFTLNVPDGGTWLVQVTPLDNKIPLRQLFLPDGNTLRTELVYTWHELWSKLEHRELENLVLDFLDKNTRPRLGGTERPEFVNRQPYDLSEFMTLSPDVTPEIVEQLSEYCTVYGDSKININVAPLEVLKLLQGLDSGGGAEGIVSYREERPIENIEILRSIPGLNSGTVNRLMNILGFKSRFFAVKLERFDEDGNVLSSFNIVFDRTAKITVKWEEFR